MIYTPTVEHEASAALCAEIAKRSHGVCFLGFSGGKDGLCAWLNLRRYFRRIIPFHCCGFPGMRFRERALEYYEFEFQTRILRLLGEETVGYLSNFAYQLESGCDEIEDDYRIDYDLDKFNKIKVIEWLRYAYNLPNAWCAFGIQASDSIDRRIYCNKTGGKSEEHKTFYPCWDWSRAEIVATLRESGLKLSPEYRYLSRTMTGQPCATYNSILCAHFPEDYRRFKALYPLIGAKNLREYLIERAWEEQKEERMRENTRRLSAGGAGAGGEDAANGDSAPNRGAGAGDDAGGDGLEGLPGLGGGAGGVDLDTGFRTGEEEQEDGILPLSELEEQEEGTGL